MASGVIAFRKGHQQVALAGTPFWYDEGTGEVLIGTERVDGHLFLDQMKHVIREVEKSRVRHGLDPKPGAGQGFVGLHLDGDGVFREQRDAAWRNLPLCYPEKVRERAKAAIDQARASVDDAAGL